MKGHLECISGPMYCGKTEESIRRLRRAEIGGKKTVVFKPVIDDRYDENDIVSHSGLRAKAFPVHNSNSILELLVDWGPFDVVAIDEAQFFDSELPQVINILINKGIRVIASGLDMDFRKEPFGTMPGLMARARYIVKLTAICQKCGGEAMYTQRILNGQPAPLDGNIVEVGGVEVYEARCENCWGSK